MYWLSDYDEIARLREPLKLKEFVICKDRHSRLIGFQTRIQAMSSGQVYELTQFGSAKMGAGASCEVVDVERYAEAIKRVTVYFDDDGVQGIKLSGGASSGETFVRLGNTRGADYYKTILLDGRLVGFEGMESYDPTKVTRLRLIQQRDTYISSQPTAEVHYTCHPFFHEVKKKPELSAD